MINYLLQLFDEIFLCLFAKGLLLVTQDLLLNHLLQLLIVYSFLLQLQMFQVSFFEEPLLLFQSVFMLLLSFPTFDLCFVIRYFLDQTILISPKFCMLLRFIFSNPTLMLFFCFNEIVIALFLLLKSFLQLLSLFLFEHILQLVSHIVLN